MTEAEWDPTPSREWAQEEEEGDELNGIREKQRRGLIWRTVLGGLLVMGGVGLTIWLLIAYDRASEQGDRIDELENVNEERSDDLGRLSEGIDELRRQVEGLGGVPVVPSGEDLVQEQGASDPDDPERQDPEIQDPEIQDPEEQEAEANDLDPDDPDFNDPEINDPDPDDEVTFAQVMAVVVAFCEANDGCQGPAGEDGADGTTTCPAGFHFALINIPSHEPAFLVCTPD